MARRILLPMWILALGVVLIGCPDDPMPPADDDDDAADDDTGDDDTGDDDTGDDDTGDDDDTTSYDDADGDTITDQDEGLTDADNDGTPNFEDPDSDGDTIPDSVEAGDSDPGTPPVDTDGDTIPDFLDDDSDDNGIPDIQETGDLDGDGIPDANDPDDDGDGIPDLDEWGDDPNTPVDTDGDQTPDYQDLDSDDDGLSDLDEGFGDADNDGLLDSQETDADGDGLPDAQEGLGDPDGDGMPNAQDLDSDNDGLTDDQDPAPLVRDADGDGYTDLAEETYGTNPLDPNDFPGDDTFYVEIQAREETELDVDFTPEITMADVVFLLDSTCSMQGTLDTVSTLFAQIVNDVTLIIPDLTFGVVEVRDYYYGDFGIDGDLPFVLDQQMTTNTGAVQSSLASLTASGGWDAPEAMMEALYQTATGIGYDQQCNFTYDANKDVPPFQSHMGDAFGGTVPGIYDPNVPGTGDQGGAGFRAGVVPIFVYATDTFIRDADTDPAPPACSFPAGRADTVAMLNYMGAKLIGVATETLPLSKMNALAMDTNSLVDLDNDGFSDDPLVFDTNVGNVVADVITGITALAAGVTYDISLDIYDPSGYGFVTYVTPTSYPDVPVGTLVTFTLGISTMGPNANEDQCYLIYITVLGDNVVVLQELTLILVVTP